jgi:segregation and condensation protein B
METKSLKAMLESLLFVSGKPLKIKDFSRILEIEENEIQSALDALAEEKKENGIILLENSGEYQLATNSKYSTTVKNFLNSELREKLTEATVEVLAIIAYRQPISKAEIEAIRGVNSQYSIRNLLMRGLVEKTQNPSDMRSFLYQTTTEFLMHLGLSSIKELPDFETLVAQIKLPENQVVETEKIEERISKQTDNPDKALAESKLSDKDTTESSSQTSQI